MTFAVTLWIMTILIILGSLVLSTALQIRGQRIALAHQAEVREKLDEHHADLAANRERAEGRSKEVRELQHESLDLKRKEIALREEQAAALRQLVAMHEELLTKLRGPSRET